MKRLRLVRASSRCQRRVKADEGESTRWNWKEKASVGGILSGVLLLILATPIVDMRMKYNAALDQRLSKWRTKYDLTESQVNKIRAIEENFHTFSAVAFGIGKPRSQEEIEAHCREVASHMHESAGEIFLRDGDDQRE